MKFLRKHKFIASSKFSAIHRIKYKHKHRNLCSTFFHPFHFMKFNKIILWEIAISKIAKCGSRFTKMRFDYVKCHFNVLRELICKLKWLREFFEIYKNFIKIKKAQKLIFGLKTFLSLICSKSLQALLWTNNSNKNILYRRWSSKLIKYLAQLHSYQHFYTHPLKKSS